MHELSIVPHAHVRRLTKEREKRDVQALEPGADLIITTFEGCLRSAIYRVSLPTGSREVRGKLHTSHCLCLRVSHLGDIVAQVWSAQVESYVVKNPWHRPF